MSAHNAIIAKTIICLDGSIIGADKPSTARIAQFVDLLDFTKIGSGVAKLVARSEELQQKSKFVIF